MNLSSVCTCSGSQWVQIQESCWHSPWQFGQTGWGTESSLGHRDRATLCSETDEPDGWSSAAPPGRQRNTDSEILTQGSRDAVWKIQTFKDEKIQRHWDYTIQRHKETSIHWQRFSNTEMIEGRYRERRLHWDSVIQIQTIWKTSQKRLNCQM